MDKGRKRDRERLAKFLDGLREIERGLLSSWMDKGRKRDRERLAKFLDGQGSEER